MSRSGATPWPALRNASMWRKQTGTSTASRTIRLHANWHSGRLHDPANGDAVAEHLVDMSWMWTLAFGYHEDRTPTHGYAATREAAMAAFARSWRRE